MVSKYVVDIFHMIFFQGNHIGIDGAEFISKMLEKNSSITILKIRSNYCLFAVGILMTHFQENDIGDEGVHYISNMLEKNKTITVLNIGGILACNNAIIHEILSRE